MNNLITTGELAKLASTTKRTIHFYDEKGVLKPVKINQSNYRLYQERQVLDYQMILLLSTLGISLEEIKRYLKNKGNLSNLFSEKKHLIKNEIERLKFSLNNIEQYLSNLQSNGTLVDPEIKTIDPFEVYYINKVGPYAKIDSYCQELSKMFTNKRNNFITLSIFEDQGYRPKESRIKICAFANEGVKVKNEFKSIVKRMTFSPGKVITYTYRGSGNMLSLFWKELEKYCRLKGYKVRAGIRDYEVYWKINPNPIKQRFEIFLPIN
ncbi:MAG: hypothetical protein UX85_C0003G0084 [Candidatus Beckwithbacteria bacterium GW2011_GWB1_47_15]|uniref:HTH merR-type domain-containing protein n=1 Tax=Candidatus Beckwithbacteria bacterium GW2011_GWB1_47_15 TaxID=1618371 RepID=A0A0G1UUM9_9BACT|nr:MAG: transcriptional regulator, MerR family [Candidatus Beckwithbacteria bacterium GW2011_GWC1_49_16]KKU35330.1 MAG: hypothetical protein UX50_C0004G0061 [Candidatus Beckwithbacteria bacterium GW2011_GWA1_46_30]KKU61425.1 MAG: hypothetical protein UX85_C0003G0084 [Candidatus Beckwithbacteria bacterium GW2011_GWB1_47_15]KKU71832.1 MAG: hypothetical protein UX97_C0003G0061 [Candidatus Beckwithbacteria bacterium GW2011_GWA2_47_25]KKW03726.1 MAG: hypothetical protein UY37_C0004G0019 [Candidatus 